MNRYYKQNKEKRLKQVNTWSKKNQEKTKSYKAKWKDKNKNYSKLYQQNRLKTDPIFKLTRNLRTRLYLALKSKVWKKNTSFYKYIGCSLEELKSHIEKQFKDGMNWDNYGKWHIDHIVPLSSAKTEENIYKLCHYNNLQPLWAIDNMKKGANTPSSS